MTMLSDVYLEQSPVRKIKKQRLIRNITKQNPKHRKRKEDDDDRTLALGGVEKGEEERLWVESLTRKQLKTQPIAATITLKNNCFKPRKQTADSTEPPLPPPPFLGRELLLLEL